ncbi:MAG: hypothetical protein ACTSSC_11980 [Promethearchaeota archaeon]
MSVIISSFELVTPSSSSTLLYKAIIAVLTQFVELLISSVLEISCAKSIAPLIELPLCIDLLFLE